MNTTENTKEIEEELLVNDLEDMSYSVNNYLIYGKRKILLRCP